MFFGCLANLIPIFTSGNTYNLIFMHSVFSCAMGDWSSILALVKGHNFDEQTCVYVFQASQSSP